MHVGTFTHTSLAPAAAVLLLGATAHAQAPKASDGPTAFIHQFEASFGRFKGYRCFGARGMCAMGEFVGLANACPLSVASAFGGKPVPVVVRFSVCGAKPKAPENTKTQRNLAQQFNLPKGERWQIGNISPLVFGASTPGQFLGLLVSRQPDPATKVADPAKVKAFNEANPEVLLLPKHLASPPVPDSFAGVNYRGVYTFGFVNAAGVTQYGKWVFEPAGGLQGLSDDEAKAKGASFLFDELRTPVYASTRQGRQSRVQRQPRLGPCGQQNRQLIVPLPDGRKRGKPGRVEGHGCVARRWRTLPEHQLQARGVAQGRGGLPRPDAGGVGRASRRFPRAPSDRRRQAAVR
jgi:catalase